ncbi:MAG: lysylphosphatidylglycerol synthase transmembrane domain-containing protein [Candidatus Omnitrophota bacterium]
MKKSLFNLGRIAITGFLLFILVVPASRFISSRFPLVKLAGLSTTLKGVLPGYVIPAALLSVFSGFLVTWRWQIILRREQIPFILLLRLTFIGFFFNNFLPTGAGGDAVKGYYFLRDKERKLDLGLSIVIDRLIGTLSVMSLCFVAVLIRFPYISRSVAYVVVGVFLAILLFFLLIAWQRLGRLAGRWSVRLLPWKKPEEGLRRLYYGFHNYIQDTRSFSYAILVSYLTQILAILANYLVALGLRTSIPFISFLVAIPLIWASTTVPSLGGLGVRETAYLFFFQNQMGRESAFGLALIMLVISFFNSLIGAVVYFARKV